MMIFWVILAIVVVCLSIEVVSALFTFVAAIFLPMLVLIPTGFLIRSIAKGRRANTVQRRGHYYDR